MDDSNNQQSTGDSNNQQLSGGPVQGGPEGVDTIVRKRSAVRMKMAVALMAVGGALAAAAIWFFASGRNSGQ